jgi:GT2 family glycosyltransferase
LVFNLVDIKENAKFDNQHSTQFLLKNLRIVVAAYKADDTIKNCIDAIINALYFHESWEIYVVDNGQNFRLDKILNNYPVIILKRDKLKSAAFSRNEGAKNFNKGVLVFIDSDVVCEKKSIENLIVPINQKKCHASIGNYSTNVAGLKFSQKYKQLYIHHIYNNSSFDIKNDFWTAICAVDAQVFNELGGFDVSFMGANGEDQEFGIRLTRFGYSVLFVNNALGKHLNPYGVFNIIKNDFKKGLKAVLNSLDNKVPLSDNRHAKMTNKIAVLFAISTLVLLAFVIFNIYFIYLSFLSFLMWLCFRSKLILTFIKNGGGLFFLKAILFMFCLDIIRFICVFLGFLKFYFDKFK